MAVRNDFTSGEVLSAADLNDTFASKPAATYASSAPGSPATGDIWYDTNSTPALAKFYDGSSWQTFSEGAADFSNSATGTYTDTGVDYKYITFTASGTLTVTKAGFADVLVIGGGGSGATWRGGGGGAGGHLYATNVYIPAGSNTVTIGAGGVGIAATDTIYQPGQNGNASRLGNFYSPGGGGGNAIGENSSLGPRQSNGFNGGSGGGGGDFDAVGGAGTAGLGNNGGNAASLGGGGGGGAGAAGSNATSSSVGGNGGAGLANSITGSSVTRAGGGGGGSVSTLGTGGSGGGGNAGGTPGAGTANTGGGGGASTGTTKGGNGGSGVVIVRVKV